ncbi:DciA family protein [Streptomyces sp. Da 82-17]|uniref:DciA family protein n=1 Tax=Streptomyces sp. Da 82-17 TaxID=3377116 RepID=UPI0038D4C8AE
MTDQTLEPSGVDMARAALAAARAAAKSKPAPTKKRTTKASARRSQSGRDPIVLGGAIERMMTEHGMDVPTAGGGLVEQWPTIAPELAQHVAAVRFDTETGLLHLRPTSPAYATQLRLLQAQVVKRIREKTGLTAVRGLRVLAPTAAPTRSAATEKEHPEPTANRAPVRTRETACDGYKAARDAISPRPKSKVASAVVEAISRQTELLREKREPDDAFRDALWEADRLASKQQPADRSEEVRRAALQQKRREGAGALPRRAFDVA